MSASSSCVGRRGVMHHIRPGAAASTATPLSAREAKLSPATVIISPRSQRQSADKRHGKMNRGAMARRRGVVVTQHVERAGHRSAFEERHAHAVAEVLVVERTTLGRLPLPVRRS